MNYEKPYKIIGYYEESLYIDKNSSNEIKKVIIDVDRLHLKPLTKFEEALDTYYHIRDTNQRLYDLGKTINRFLSLKFISHGEVVEECELIRE